MRLSKKLAGVVIVFSVLFSQMVMAESFCMISGLGIECTFTNESDCKKLAATLDGECVRQSEAKKSFNAIPTSGDWDFCLVTDLSNECSFVDFDSCNSVALKMMMRCVPNLNKF